MSAQEREDKFLRGLHDALAADPYVALLGVEKAHAGEVRVLCPKGHFVANIAIVDLGQQRLVMRPRGQDGEYFGDAFSDPNHGFRFDHRDDDWRALPDNSGGYRVSSRVGQQPRLRIRLHCINKRCSYDGSFDYLELTNELGKVGHAEYRLTN